ncbi:MAG TPA: ABC transporter permease [Casimicrobiaceae bacterium]|jgi:ABC-type nitrate/sulfonate/bicarbonate transport system permease component|nr:ABC transporter permease [Casimicrobiaceae bacterium]
MLEWYRYHKKMGSASVRRRAVGGILGAATYARAMLFFLLLWHLVSVWIANPVLLPGPLRVMESLFQMVASGELVEHALVSLRRLAVSFVAAGAIGIPLGVAMGMNRPFDDIVDPLVEVLRPISGIAWIPLALFILGVGDALPIFIMFYGALFPFVLNSYAAVRAVPPRYADAARTMGVPRRRIIANVMLPAALPGILVGARLAAGAGWMSMVAAELIGAPSGLGFAVEWYRELLMTSKMLAVVVSIGILGYTIDRVLRAVQHRMAPWSPAVRSEQ